MSSSERESSAAQPASPETSSEASGRGTVGATTAVDAALAGRGAGQAHESGATIHDDAKAHTAADALGANAFAAGNDVYFGAGKFAPGSEGGDKLIQHELAHVQQARGVAAPEPGNFRVSDPAGGAEAEAKAGGEGTPGSAEAATIYRDEHGGPAPAAGGAGPAAGGAGPSPAPGGPSPAPGEPAAGGAGGAGAAPAAAPDPYEAFKAAVAARARADANTKWSALGAADKAKVGAETIDFHRSVIYAMHKDAPKVLKGGNVKVSSLVYAIFLDDEFDQWLPEMRTAGILTPFLIASPTKGLVSRTEAQKLQTWVTVATNVAEAKAIFHKVYPTLLDTSPISAASAKKGIAAVAWTTVPLVARLYSILAESVPVGHVQTIQGFFLTTGAGYGWWQPWNFLVALPQHAGASSKADDLSKHGGHGMTGGANSGSTSPTGGNTYTAPGGAAGAGANAAMGHYETSVLHEVGHGVGQRMGGNTYAKSASSWPGWTGMTPQTWGEDLWTAGTGPVDATVTSNAKKMKDEHVKAFMISELGSGKNTYTFDPGWFSSAPPRADVVKWINSKYSNVPLQKWWKHLVEDGADKGSSYKWTEPSARIKGSWAYSYLTRGDTPFMKFKAAAYNQKVSWYSISSPHEWWAEQYAHYYRTEKSGGGLIDATTKGMLDRLDGEAWSATSADGASGVQYPTSLNRGEGGEGGAGGGGAGGGGADGAAAGGQAAAAPAEAEQQTQPLFFPW